MVHWLWLWLKGSLQGTTQWKICNFIFLNTKYKVSSAICSFIQTACCELNSIFKCKNVAADKQFIFGSSETSFSRYSAFPNIWGKNLSFIDVTLAGYLMYIHQKHNVFVGLPVEGFDFFVI